VSAMTSLIITLFRWKAQLFAWWKPHYWTRVAVFMCPVAIILPHCLLRTNHHPPVGTYIAIMGGLAAVVTLREKPPLKEKAAWIVLIAFVMVAEIQNLYVVDREQASIFSSIQGGLQSTKNGLDQTARGLQATTNALSGVSQDINNASGDNQKQFGRTMATLNISHQQDEREFAGIIGQEKEVLKSQQEMSEQFCRTIGTWE
jgi:uncharacterized membrane protein YoaK (UPF0700 family)